ncbi:MAG: hypothetical protein Q8O99_07135 [bacterium]|nr:hypothetical protein [bacterium]
MFILIFFPVMRIQQLDDVTSSSIRFFGSGMVKLQILVIIIFLKLIALNSTTRRKKIMYNTFGYTSNEYMDNAIILIVFFVLVITMGETLGFFTGNISTVVTPTAGFLILGIGIVGGIARQLMLTRLQRKKQGKAKQTQANIGHELDMSKKERQFKTSEEKKLE